MEKGREGERWREEKTKRRENGLDCSVRDTFGFIFSGGQKGNCFLMTLRFASLHIRCDDNCFYPLITQAMFLGFPLLVRIRLAY